MNLNPDEQTALARSVEASLPTRMEAVIKERDRLKYENAVLRHREQYFIARITALENQRKEAKP